MEDKTIYTDDGLAIPWFDMKVEHFLDYVTLIFGAPGSGKTTIIEHILHLCRGHIPNYFVVAPRGSNMPYHKKLPSRCIKEDFTKEKLMTIWKRQENISQLYNLANNIKILERLFLKTRNREAIVMANAIRISAENKIRAVDQRSDLNHPARKLQKTVIDNIRHETTKHLYQRTIRENRALLEQSNLDREEKIALECLDINPRLMIIVDDSTEKIKTWKKLFKKTEINPFESIFFRGRWSFITFILIAHDDKLLDTEFRKSARITIYTTSQAVMASLNKPGNGYTASEKKDAQKMIKKIFAPIGGMITFQKFCYIRNDINPFKYMIVDVHPDFSIGCNLLRDLTNKMPEVENKLENNQMVRNIIQDEKNTHSDIKRIDYQGVWRKF